MTNNQILLGSLGLAYIDILAASHFAGQWQAAVFAALSVPCVGIALMMAHKVVKPRE
jgi:hypothetical protein